MTNTLEQSILGLGDFVYRANGGNAGDCIIASAEFALFDRLGVHYKQALRKTRQSLTSSGFNLVFGGGGGWIGLYHGYYQRPLNDYLRNPDLKRCVILPSSFWRCDDVVTSFDERFTVFCRDRPSYEYCTSRNGQARFLLHDDLAFSIKAGTLLTSNAGCKVDIVHKAADKVDEFLRQNNRSVARFLRHDREATGNVKAQQHDFDLSNIANPHGEDLTRDVADGVSSVFLSTINKFSTIITDRLHVMIASCILGKQVGFFDNTYGKLSAVYDLSIRGKKEYNVCRQY